MLMDNDINFTELLYKISKEYEDRIRVLEKENYELKKELNQRSMFQFREKLKSLLSRMVRKIINILKNLIVRLGLKDYVKKTKLFHLLKEKLRGFL